jgi:peptidylprolyl isomerase
VATSRRRERELARRRFERRRQAEAERREKAHKRNTVMGAVIGSVVVLAAVAIGGYAIVHHSNNHKSKTASASSTPSPSTSTSTTPAPAAPTSCVKVNPNPPAKGDPVVPDVKGKLTNKLVINDIKKGTGAAAKAGDSITVKYVGVACSTGKAFDASYTDGAPKQEFTFVLGKGSVIPGWDQGLVGMKVGGQRQLIIPAALAYGASGSGATIKGNETLNFVVNLVKV